jgi:serine/threonine-protein kinase RsbW
VPRRTVCVTVSDTLLITSELVRIRDARRWATGHAARAGFSEQAVEAVELALGEALANVIRHAYDGREGEEIRIALTIDAERLVLEIRDSAAPFARDSVPVVPLDTVRTGGYGLQLIDELMDQVLYTAADSGGLIRMVKLRNA